MNFFLDSLIQNMTDNLSKAMNQTYTQDTSNSNDSENMPLKLNVGDVLTGEITDIRPQEIKIKMDNNQIITAELKEQFDLYIGQVLKFQVKDYDGGQILLRPMLEDSSQNAAIVKALGEANIPVSAQMEAIVNALLAENMSIDKSTLQNIYKDMINFKDSDPNTIVNLYKFKIPVTEQSLLNMESYNSEKYPILQKLDTIANQLPETLQALAAENKTEQFMAVLKNFLPAEIVERLSSLLNNNDAGQSATNNNWQNNNGNSMNNGSIQSNIVQNNAANNMPNNIAQNNQINDVESHIDVFLKLLTQGEGNGNADHIKQPVVLQNAVTGQLSIPNQNTEGTLGTTQTAGTNAENEQIPTQNLDLSKEVAKEADQLQAMSAKSSGQSTNMQNITNANQPYAENMSKEMGLQNNGGQETATMKVSSQVETPVMQNGQELTTQNDFLDKADVRKTLLALLSRDSFKDFIKNEILTRMLISPKELEKEEGLTSYYKRLDKQIQEMAAIIKNDTDTGAQLNKQFTETRESIDFLNQLNQTATYVQIPLKLSSQNQNADLYVYTDKRALKNKQNQVTAFLHLNLNYLGDLDVYISMQNKDLKVNFYVKEGNSIPFIKQNMEKLMTEFNQIGYTINAGVFPKLEEIPVIDRIKQEEQQSNEHKEEKSVKRYSFDVRM